MLFVLFQLGKDRYALEASRVVEVLPLVALKRLPQAGRGVAGLFVYRGQPVPAVDLCVLLFDRPAQERLSTRIIVVNFSADAAEENQMLGLIAERATGILRCDAREFKDMGLQVASASFLGPVRTDEQGVIQLVHAQKLLSGHLRDLFSLAAQPVPATGG